MCCVEGLCWGSAVFERDGAWVLAPNSLKSVLNIVDAKLTSVRPCYGRLSYLAKLDWIGWLDSPRQDGWSVTVTGVNIKSEAVNDRAINTPHSDDRAFRHYIYRRHSKNAAYELRVGLVIVGGNIGVRHNKFDARQLRRVCTWHEHFVAFYFSGGFKRLLGHGWR